MDQMGINERTFVEPESDKRSFEKLILVPGNCLFYSLDALQPDESTLFFMAEDPGLCTRYAFNKHKLIFVLSSMRSYRDWLKAQYNLIYWELSEENEISLKENPEKENLKENENLIYEHWSSVKE